MRRLVLISLVLTALTAPALAQDEGDLPYGIIVAEQARASFALLGAGARAAGMGGAFTAVADDATAASFNPAGLAQLLVPEVSVVGSYSRIEDKYTDFVSFGDDVPFLTFGDATIDYAKSDLNFLSFTVPFRLANRRWAFQASQHRRVDFGYEGTLDLPAYDSDGEQVLQVTQAARQIGDITTLSASLAVELTSRTLIGVSVNRWAGDWNFGSFNESYPPDDPSSIQRFTYQQTNSFEGTNFDLGLLLRYPKFNVGIRYSTAFDADYSFRANDLDPESSDLPTGLDTTLHWPQRLNIGVALKPSDRWTIALDWGRSDWSELTFDLPTEAGYDVPVNFFDLRPAERTTTDEANDWRIGAELLFFAGEAVVPLRFGFFHEPQPSRDMITGERVEWRGLSVGAGFKHKGIAFDIAAHYKNSDTAVSRYFLFEEPGESDINPNSIGNLERDEISVFASVIFQFGKGSWLGKAWNSVFVGPAEPRGDGVE